MRKAKLLIAVLVCSVMLMGVGYAWWTDSVVLFGNIATGNMKVEIGDIDVGVLTEGTYAVDLPTITTAADGKRIDCKFTNIIPGAVGILNANLKNTGSVPVKFNNMTITLTGEGDFINYLQVGLKGEGDVITYYSVNQFKNWMNGNEQLKNTVVYCEESLPIPELYLRLNPAVNNDSQNANGTFCVEFNMIQFDPMTDPYPEP